MISLPLYPELFLFLSPLDEMEDPDNKLDEKHCVKLITTIISFGRIMSESAVNMTVFGNELVKIYPPSELYEEVTIFEMVTALLPEIACHDIIPYLCARSDYSLIRSFIMSMIIIVMGAISISRIKDCRTTSLHCSSSWKSSLRNTILLN